MKDDVKMIISRTDIDDKTKVGLIVELIVDDYYKYSKDEIKDLSKEFCYCLLDAFDTGEAYTPKMAIDNLKNWYLGD